jgi:hypothetical protein
MGNIREIFKPLIEQWIEDLRRGELTEESLRRGLEALDRAASRCQDLLYLQANGTGLESAVCGMSLIQNGQIAELPEDAKDWPYPTVLDAIRDGWNVIQFPNLALQMDESRTYGLGCEFILEKKGQ